MNPKVVILVVASKGFQPVEYGDTLKVLQDEGLKVITASNSGDTAVSSKGDPVNVDITIDKIKKLLDGMKITILLKYLKLIM